MSVIYLFPPERIKCISLKNQNCNLAWFSVPLWQKKTKQKKTVCIEPWTDYLLHACYSMRKKKQKSMHEYRATQRGKHVRCSLLPLPQLVPSFHTDALPTLHLMREERRHKCMYVEFVCLIVVVSSVMTTDILAFTSHVVLIVNPKALDVIGGTGCWDPAVSWRISSSLNQKDPSFLSFYVSGTLIHSESRDANGKSFGDHQIINQKQQKKTKQKKAMGSKSEALLQTAMTFVEAAGSWRQASLQTAWVECFKSVLQKIPLYKQHLMRNKRHSSRATLWKV